ncbi:hypothetical protein HDU76_013325 [Blyttiomyces sp. JEL0837]|nr:hypothetical protein HDU76_013325 [Blyttiomyces sp. JEL0837]
MAAIFKLLAARTTSAVTFFASRKCTSRSGSTFDHEIELKDVDSFSLGSLEPLHVAFNPVVPYEAAMICDGSSIYVWNAERSCKDPENKLSVVFNGEWDDVDSVTLATNTLIDCNLSKWRQLEYGWHPQTLLAARSKQLSHIDMRAPVRSLSSFCERLDSGLITAIAPDSTNRFQFAMCTTERAFYIDGRYPKVPLLEFDYYLDVNQSNDPVVGAQIIELNREPVLVTWNSRHGEILAFPIQSNERDSCRTYPLLGSDSTDYRLPPRCRYPPQRMPPFRRNFQYYKNHLLSSMTINELSVARRTEKKGRVFGADGKSKYVSHWREIELQEFPPWPPLVGLAIVPSESLEDGWCDNITVFQMSADGAVYAQKASVGCSDSTSKSDVESEIDQEAMSNMNVQGDETTKWINSYETIANAVYDNTPHLLQSMKKINLRRIIELYSESLQDAEQLNGLNDVKELTVQKLNRPVLEARHPCTLFEIWNPRKVDWQYDTDLNKLVKPAVRNWRLLKRQRHVEQLMEDFETLTAKSMSADTMQVNGSSKSITQTIPSSLLTNLDGSDHALVGDSTSFQAVRCQMELMYCGQLHRNATVPEYLDNMDTQPIDQESSKEVVPEDNRSCFSDHLLLNWMAADVSTACTVFDYEKKFEELSEDLDVTDDEVEKRESNGKKAATNIGNAPSREGSDTDDLGAEGETGGPDDSSDKDDWETEGYLSSNSQADDIKKIGNFPRLRLLDPSLRSKPFILSKRVSRLIDVWKQPSRWYNTKDPDIVRFRKSQVGFRSSSALYDKEMAERRKREWIRDEESSSSDPEGERRKRKKKKTISAAEYRERARQREEQKFQPVVISASQQTQLSQSQMSYQGLSSSQVSQSQPFFGSSQHQDFASSAPPRLEINRRSQSHIPFSQSSIGPQNQALSSSQPSFRRSQSQPARGLSADHARWDFQKIYFSQLEEYTVCVFDNRGVGFSSAPATRYTTRMMALDTWELMQHLQWKRAHVVGLSMGEKLQEFEVFESELTAPAPPSSGCFDNTEFMRKWWEDRKERVPLPSPQGIRGQRLACYTHHMSRRRLHKLRDSGIPIIVITGDSDVVVRPSNSIYLARNLRSRLELFVGGGHGLAVQFPDRFNAVLLKHFRRSLEIRPYDDDELRSAHPSMSPMPHLSVDDLVPQRLRVSFGPLKPGAQLRGQSQLRAFTPLSPLLQ